MTIKLGTRSDRYPRAQELQAYAVSQASTSAESDNGGPGPWVMGTDTLVGNKVCDAGGEYLGVIEEIMIDTGSGRVAYAVLSFGGVFGLGNKLFAIPWNAFELDTEHKRFVLRIDKERLDGAPGFDKDRWPAMADPTWAYAIHEFYETKPYWAR